MLYITERFHDRLSPLNLTSQGLMVLLNPCFNMGIHLKG